MNRPDRPSRHVRVLHAVARHLQPLAPLLTRIVIGWAFVRTGFGKLAHFDRAVDFFDALGIPAPLVALTLVATLELVGGTMLCLGLATRATAALLSLTMLVATATADRASFVGALAMDGLAPVQVVPLLFLLFLLWLVADGGGAVGLDRLFARARPSISAAGLDAVRRRIAAAGGTAVARRAVARGVDGWRRTLRQPERLAAPMRTVAALATRLAVGWTFVAQGLASGRGSWAFAEVAVGVCVVLGLMTRAVALLLAIAMAAVLATADRDLLVAAAVPGGEIGLLEVVPLVLMLLLGWLALHGAGACSLDRWLPIRSRTKPRGTAGDAATEHREPKRIVILGGGFGGMYAAMELERLLAGDPGANITVVDQDNYLLFTPMLHEVAASDLDLTHVVSATRKLLRHAAFVNGEVIGIDAARREVEVAHGIAGSRHVLRYDHLVVAMGSVTNFHGLRGLEQGAFTMRTLGDAIALRNRLIASMEEANVAVSAEERRRLLTFVVAGGGFAGVETIAAINDFVRETRRFYPNLGEQDVRMVLVHSGDRILPELDARLGAYAEEKLTERGVELRLGTRVRGFDRDEVELGDTEALPSRTLVWTAGTAPHPLLASLPGPKERGRLAVDATMAVPGHPGLWGLGDCAAVPDLVRGGFCPPTAQHATRQGRLLARNIVATLRGRSPREFRFRMLGQLAALGRRSGVAQVFGLRFSGFVAWWLWRSIYLLKLPGLERKVRVALDWTLDLAFSKDLVKCPTDRTPRPRAADRTEARELAASER